MSVKKRLSDIEARINVEPMQVQVIWDDSERDPDAITVEWDDDDEAGAAEFEWRLERVYGDDDDG